MQNHHKFTLDTPCLIIDKDKLFENINSMQQEINGMGKKLRPHIKTHKCTTLAKLQIEAGAVGVCAAKMGEVEVLLDAGISNILITSPVVTPKKIERLIACLHKSSDLSLVVDSTDNATQLNDVMEKVGLTLSVLVDIDPGVARTGISYHDAIVLGQFIEKLPCLTLVGIQCYAGNLQHVNDYQERREYSQGVMQQAAQVVNQYREAGLPCAVLTGSGTGTYDIDCDIEAVTEVQPGSYTVMDMEYRLIGSSADSKRFERFKPAMTMLVTVISANHDSHVTVDAGTKALYFDPVTKPKVISHPGLHYDWSVFGDEHGKITADPEVELPKVGEVLELIVPHCDPTINLFNTFYITKNDQVIDTWEINMRGKCY